MVLGRKTNFFPRENMVLGKEDQLYPRQNQNKPSFLDFGRIVAKRWFFGVILVFTRKNLVFLPKIMFFSYEKVGFSRQNHLVPRKKLLSCPKPFFSGKPNKKIFLESGRIVSESQRMFFFWFSLRKSSFLIGRAQCCVDYVLTSNLKELTDTFC